MPYPPIFSIKRSGEVAFSQSQMTLLVSFSHPDGSAIECSRCLKRIISSIVAKLRIFIGMATFGMGIFVSSGKFFRFGLVFVEDCVSSQKNMVELTLKFK